MDIVEFVSRYAHVLTAIVLAGGAMFLRFVLLPAVDGTELKEPLHERVRPKWAKFVAIGTLVLIVTGFYNYIVVEIPIRKAAGDKIYHMILGFKMLAAFTAFFLAAALSGKSAKLQPLRDNWRTTGGLLVLLLLIVVGIGSYLKVRGVPKPPTPQLETQVQEVESATLDHDDIDVVTAVRKMRRTLT